MNVTTINLTIAERSVH